MLKNKKKLKDNSLVCIDDLRRNLNLLVDRRLHRFMSYRKLKEYIRFCLVNYDELSEGDKIYLERYFFGKKEYNDAQNK